jgi:CRP/FNR family transcriptional regulator
MLSRITIFRNIPEEYLSRLEGISRKRDLRKNTCVFAPGDATRGFYAVLQGAVRLYRLSEQGKETTLEFAREGSVFAEASLFSDIYHCYAETLTESTLYLIQKDPFLEMIRSNSQFALLWIENLSRNVIQLRHHIEEISIKSSRKRLANYIRHLAEEQNARIVSIPAWRKDIAKHLNMTQETFYRIARELEDQGAVTFHSRHIEICDFSNLQSVLES